MTKATFFPTLNAPLLPLEEPRAASTLTGSTVGLRRVAALQDIPAFQAAMPTLWTQKAPLYGKDLAAQALAPAPEAAASQAARHLSR